MLQGRVPANVHREYIDATLDQLADRLGVHRDELLDGGLPTFGFVRVGEFEQTFDVARAIVRITGARSVEVRWTKADGQPLKSIPARVKREFGTEIDKLKTLAKTVRDVLSGLSERLENASLEQRDWPVSSWREQMIDHPVAGGIGRKLIWRFGQDDAAVAAIWHNNAWRTADGRLIAPPVSATIGLWHPLFAASADVLAWRDYLEAEQITQPFKQAHREIYLLTDAERATATYSNRFASHIIRQRQFRALAKVRGWKADLVGPWDEESTRHARAAALGSAGGVLGHRHRRSIRNRVYLSVHRPGSLLSPGEPNHYRSSRFHPSCSRRSCAMSISSWAWRRSVMIPPGRTAVPRGTIATTGRVIRSASSPEPRPPASRFWSPRATTQDCRTMCLL